MLAALTLTPCLDGQPASIGCDHGLVVPLPCAFCGYEFDLDALGRFGCPNCNGEGLDDSEPVNLLPRGRLAPAILPIVSRATGATSGGDDVGSGILGKVSGEAHGQTLPRENKSAMPKIDLDKRRQCRHITRMTTTNDGQRRAAAGGELGANGEWYEGGKFIATKDNSKSCGAKRIYSAEETAAYLARKAAQAEAAAHVEAWLTARRAEHANLIELMTTGQNFNHDPGVWKQLVEGYAAGFIPSLGWTLHQSGSLSDRQAEYACKFLFNRRNKKNAAEFDALWDSLTVQYRHNVPSVAVGRERPSAEAKNSTPT